ncbi:MAG: hypothetical protein PHI85_08690, partial [Victivallaceae bacterium]|nr:hypothetical protein [Victivallaceae bacterium]
LCLNGFDGVKVTEASPSGRNMTCRKAEAMLLVDTEYISWVDCDGFFIGNCSELLVVASPDEIHLRLRSKEDNAKTFEETAQYAPDDVRGDIPRAVLNIWRQDVGEREEPRLKTCASACFFSLNRKHRDFLKRFDAAAKKLLPEIDLGVAHKLREGYYQLDESILNSLLCFMDNPPVPTTSFLLDKQPNRCYIHVIGMPKPWQWWNAYSIQYYPEIMRIVDYAVRNGRATLPLPLSLRKNLEFIHQHTLWAATLLRARFGIRRRIKKWRKRRSL